MADWHLEELNQALTQAGWSIVNQAPGDEHKVSATWTIQRNTRQQPILIDFEGLDDMKCLPLSQSYACRLREHPNLNLYFGKTGEHWRRQLQEFIAALNQLNVEKE